MTTSRTTEAPFLLAGSRSSFPSVWVKTSGPDVKDYVCYRGHRTPARLTSRWLVIACPAKVGARTLCSAGARLEAT